MVVVRRSFLALLLAFLFTQLSCKKSPTELEFKNPREYTWTATKVTYPGSFATSMYSIWGSSPTDVYISGFSGLGGHAGAVFRYDGKQWQSVRLPDPDFNELWEITGFGPNDVWLIGSKLYLHPGGGGQTVDSAIVLHFDGVRWTQMLPSHMGVRGLKSVGGTSSRNLYFGSRDGKVVRYNGQAWKVDTLYLGLSLRDIDGDQDRIFAVGNTFRGASDDSVMCFMWASDRWQLIDVQLSTQHSSSPRFGSSNIYTPTLNIYYSAGTLGIFRWDVEKWIAVSRPFAAVLGLGGSGSTSILAVGKNNIGPVVYHWDGASWEELNLPSGLVPDDVSLLDIWTNGREAFVVGTSGGVSYVLHGK